MPKLFFIFLLLLGSFVCCAFQQPTNTDSARLQAFEEQKKAAEAQFYAGNSKAALASYANLQKAYRKAGYAQQALQIYQDIFAVIVQEEGPSLSSKLAQLSGYRTQESSEDIEGLYEGALAYAYGHAAVDDSMQLHYGRAIRIFEAQQQPKFALTLNLYLAYDRYNQEKLFEAQQYIEEAAAFLKACKQNGHTVEEEILIIYNLQTVVYTDLSLYPQAIKTSLKRIDLLLNAQSTLELAYEYNNLATTYSCIDDYSNALRYYQKALQMTAADKTLQARITYNMGSNLMELQQRDSALIYFRKSLGLLQECAASDDIKIDLINNYQNIIDCFLSQDQLDSALLYSRRCAQINSNFDYRAGFTDQCFAEIYLQQDNFILAEKSIQQSLNRLQQTYGPKSEYMAGAYTIYSNITQKKKQYRRALGYLQQALASISINFVDPKGFSNPLLSNVQDKGKLIELLQKKLALMQTLYQKDITLIEGRQLYKCAQLATEALTEHNRSMKNEGSKINLLNKTSLSLYEKAIATAVELFETTLDSFYLDAAFRFSEQSKSMLMADTWHESDAKSKVIPQHLQKKEKKLRTQLMHFEKLRFEAIRDSNIVAAKQLDERCFGLKHQLDELIHLFESSYPQYYAIKYSRETTGMRAIQNSIPSDAQVIEFFEGQEKLYIFGINRQSIELKHIALNADYQLQIDRFQQAVTDIRSVNESPAEMHYKLSTTGYSLYKILLEDILRSDRKKLIIIPDGRLNLIPFEALINQEISPVPQNSKTINFGQLPYLLKEYTISYNYSAALLYAQLYQKPSNKNLEVLALAPGYSLYVSSAFRNGNVVREDLASLPGAIREVEFLQNHFAGSYLYKEAANEAAFKKEAPKFNVLHLAMHGLVNNEYPKFSSLVMDKAPSSSEDDILYAYEIQNMQLNPDLVVLSACETGVGKFQQGEGVLSIGRGFMYAGTPSLVMTLWSLNDYSGSQIIENYYQALNKGMDKDEAMKWAKLEYLEENDDLLSHPALWACYIQMGNTEPLSIKTKTFFGTLLEYWGLILAGICLSLGSVYYFHSSRKQA